MISICSCTLATAQPPDASKTGGGATIGTPNGVGQPRSA
jgi:hypothetical protein